MTTTIREALPHNTYEQVGHGGVYVRYIIPSPRSVMTHTAQVVRVGYQTNPKAAWYDYGNKSFVGRMRESVPAAKAWAEERYGIKKWKRNGLGDWIDADANYPPLRCEIERKEARRSKKEKT